MFDPESKVKFMLEGLANIILRPNMQGLLTEYQKMKIAKYEIPISALGSVMDDEVYSRRSRIDNGEEDLRIQAMLDELAKKYDDAKASRNKQPLKSKKTFPPTRRQKIEAVRKEVGVTRFDWVRVDTNNLFFYDGTYYHIPAENMRYAAKHTKDGDDLYDMDQILCAKTADGKVSFYDMNIEPVEHVQRIGEQMCFVDKEFSA